MATVKDNMLLEGLSGMFGRSIVFKNLRGKTIITPRPAAPSKQSEQQRTNRSKFRDASAWARAIVQDPLKKEYYLKKAKKLKLPNAYTAAITDYMRKPKVTRSFTEEKGTNYCVSKKNFALKKVEVTVQKNGLTETRAAQCLPGGEWNFLLLHEDRQCDVQVLITDATGLVAKHVIRS